MRLFIEILGKKNMHQWRPLRILCVGLQDTVGRVVTTNIQCWGYEVIGFPAALPMEVEGETESPFSVLEGDILLYDVDTSPHLVKQGDGTSTIQPSMFVAEGQRLRAPLTIALSSRSVSRSMLEQLGAVALLQKPFEMGHLQKYLSVLQRLLHSVPRQGPESAEHEKMRVLVVDDDVNVAHAIKKCLLYETSYEVVVAYNGLEALEQWLDWYPECIVTDLIMPWMNGYQVMRCLAVGAEHMMPGFVVMSALPSLEGPRDRSYLEGKSVAYVDKPFHVEHLLQAIKQVCAE
jgi:CheY-like chemotaxis protein